MSKMTVIATYEYAQIVRKKSFLVGILLTPLLMAAFSIVPALFANVDASKSEKMAVVHEGEPEVAATFVSQLAQYKLKDSTTPYYDVRAVLSVSVADSVSMMRVRDSLDHLINEKELLYYLVIRHAPELSDSASFVVTASDKMKSLNRFERILSGILGSERLTSANVNLPVDSILSLTRQTELPIRDTTGETVSFIVKYMAAIVFVMTMFGMIQGYGQTVMRGVIDEKSSRIMEVLVSSMSPFELLGGKLLGLCGAALTQVLVWVVLGLGIFVLSSTMQMNIDPGISRIVFNPIIVVYFVAFLISGYVLFSSVFALIGSIVNTEKEAQNFIFPITMSMVLPVMIAIGVIQDPYSTPALLFSYFPFTAPTMMMMRVIFIAPTDQSATLLSGIGLEAFGALLVVVLTAIAMIWIASRVFRIGILMYGKRPTLAELIKWVKY